ncbi:flagellar type III secretion system protein FlhB [Xinfangfangia sp. CPCC 101601]|uniref:Flagellar type III secretion system protein FlhB n=1 Tax=Pseudogemmobacter lacusdianii TaxID=3069608 RepID=A0ABU0VU85_9RHOB|nr:flagellar type III secretion system protein FlhB [Xinfangfangia sp. CPCC 101601]MDQ2065292.1 flagellar type III secretion system protein FlhB [Xinfangfangia sp. CPCC 101601]
MAAGTEDEGEKEYDPSERKLSRAREEGDVLRSEDLQAAAGLAGLVLGLILMGGWAVTTAGQAGMQLLAQPDRLAGLVGKGAMPQLGGIILQMVAPFVGILLTSAGGVVLWLLASRSLIFTPTKLSFKTSRISIVSHAKQKFGRSGMVEFAKRFAKMMAVAALLSWFLQRSLPEVIMASWLEPGLFARLMAEEVQRFLILFFVISTCFGLADYLWQRLEFARRNRMTRKELLDEMKESEGDPHLRADRRRRAQEIATRQMLAEVPKADVVIVNPTHYAVALSWARGKDAAPRCVAKGCDEIAVRIRARAQENGVPIRRDPPTARAIFATVELGRQIKREHYAAVAAAIRFAEAMRKKARRR